MIVCVHNIHICIYVHIVNTHRHIYIYIGPLRGIHRWRLNSLHKGQWRGALMFSLIYAWINGWVNSRGTGDLRRHRAHYGVSVMRKMCLRCFKDQIKKCTHPSKKKWASLHDNFRNFLVLIMSKICYYCWICFSVAIIYIWYIYISDILLRITKCPPYSVVLHLKCNLIFCEVLGFACRPCLWR